MSNYESYKEVLSTSLVQHYHLSHEEAHEAVENSCVNKMLLDNESSANWQMHQPLRSTVAEIYNEYEGKLIPA